MHTQVNALTHVNSETSAPGDRFQYPLSFSVAGPLRLTSHAPRGFVHTRAFSPRQECLLRKSTLVH